MKGNNDISKEQFAQIINIQKQEQKSYYLTFKLDKKHTNLIKHVLKPF